MFAQFTCSLDLLVLSKIEEVYIICFKSRSEILGSVQKRYDSENSENSEILKKELASVCIKVVWKILKILIILKIADLDIMKLTFYLVSKDSIAVACSEVWGISITCGLFYLPVD